MLLCHPSRYWNLLWPRQTDYAYWCLFHNFSLRLFSALLVANAHLGLRLLFYRADSSSPVIWCRFFHYFDVLVWQPCHSCPSSHWRLVFLFPLCQYIIMLILCNFWCKILIFCISFSLQCDTELFWEPRSCLRGWVEGGELLPTRSAGAIQHGIKAQEGW